MSYTKGELNCTKNTSFILCNIRTDGKGDVFCRQPQRKEDAKELVRRWNSQPDLLEACEAVSKSVGDFRPDPETMTLIDAAIAKAKKAGG